MEHVSDIAPMVLEIIRANMARSISVDRETGMFSTTVSGNLTSDPELRYISDGKAVLNATIAHNTRKKNEKGEWVNGDTLFYKIVLWGKRAENLVEHLNKGDSVLAVLKSTIPKIESWDKDGETRTTLVFTVSDIAVIPRGKPKHEAPF